MQLNNLLELSKIEVVEPETIRRFFPDLTEEKFNEIEALITIKSSNYIFENFYAFENTVLALNGIVPNTTMLEGVEPEWVWRACDIIEVLRPNMSFSSEVIEYIMKIYADDGIYFLHPYITKNNEYITDDAWEQVYAAAKHKAETGPFPIEADSFINRQAIEFLKMKQYSKTMENN